MTLDEKLLTRADALIQKGEAMKSSYSEGQISGPPDHDRKEFSEWRNQSLAFLVGMLSADHVYSKQFEKEVVHANAYDSAPGIGILRAVKQDIEGGHLSELRTLVSAEVFSDFLDMAKHLLDQGYWHPAASLIGAVLEDGLKTVAKNKNIKIQSGDDLASLNGKCSTAKLYTSIASKQVSLWTDVRNKADHGEFDKVKNHDVADMHSGVSRFLSEHLK